ncbi:MAG: cysteine hydrolase [Syntrophorhabdaceae bacterium]|nr:cysteine hydrolase [Syntrophorhabdaceae bacterium]
METFYGLSLIFQGIVPLSGLYTAATIAGTSDGKVPPILKDLRNELSPAFKQMGRPMHLFHLDPSKAAFVIIDMQNFSCTPSQGAAMTDIGKITSEINRLTGCCRSVNVPVIWVRHNVTTGPAGNDAGLYAAFHEEARLKELYNKGKGTEVFPHMHFDPSADHVVFKNRYSAFLSDPPELRRKLEQLQRTQLIVAGIAANVCVESTVRDAMQLDYEVALAADGVATFDQALLKSTLKNTMLFFGDVLTTQEIVDRLKTRDVDPSRSLRR